MTKYHVIYQDDCGDHRACDLTAESVDVSPMGLAFYNSDRTLVAAFRNWDRFVCDELVAA